MRKICFGNKHGQSFYYLAPTFIMLYLFWCLSNITMWLTSLYLSSSSIWTLYESVAFSNCRSLFSCSSREVLAATPIDATPSSWFSIQGPTMFAFCANCRLSLSLFSCLILSSCNVLSLLGTNCFTSPHLLEMSLEKKISFKTSYKQSTDALKTPVTKN